MQQSLQDGAAVRIRNFFLLQFYATIALRRVQRGIGAAVTKHNACQTCVDCRLEAHQVILFKGTFHRIDPPLAGFAVGFKAVQRGSITGEMLDGQRYAALPLTVLIASDQRRGNTAIYIRNFGEGSAVAGPAGIGNQVDLGTIHTIQAAGIPNLPIQISIPLYQAVISAISHVAHNSSGHALRSRSINDLLRIGNAEVRHKRRIVDQGIHFGKHVCCIIKERSAFYVGCITGNAGSIFINRQLVHTVASTVHIYQRADIYGAIFIISIGSFGYIGAGSHLIAEKTNTLINA